MSEVADIVITILLSVLQPILVNALAVVSYIISAFVVMLSNAIGNALVGQHQTITVPIVVFGNTFRAGTGQIMIPVGVMYFVVALSALNYMRYRRPNDTAGLAIAGLMGIFVPIVTVHVVNLVLYNMALAVEGIQANQVEGMAILRMSWSEVHIASMLGVVARDVGMQAVFAVLVGTVGGCLLLVFVSLLSSVTLLFVYAGAPALAFASVAAISSAQVGEDTCSSLLPVVCVFDCPGGSSSAECSLYLCGARESGRGCIVESLPRSTDCGRLYHHVHQSGAGVVAGRVRQCVE